MTQAMTTEGARRASGGRQPTQCPPFLFGAKGASAGESIKQRHPFRCNETKTSPTAGRKSLWSPSQRHHQSLWQAKTNFSQDKCTRCSPSKWPIVGALPAQYLGRGPGPLPINRTSHPQGRGGSINQAIRERERRVTELLLAVHRPSQEQALTRLFFLVLLIIISPRGNPHATNWSRVLHHNGGPNQYKPCVSCAVLFIAEILARRWGAGR